MNDTNTRRRRLLRRWLPALAVCALAAGCATAPPPEIPITPGADAAVAAEDQGDWEQAAAQWERAAEGSPEADAASAAWLRAADAWWKAGDALRSTQALDAVREDTLGRQDSGRLALLRGERALALADAEQATFYLDAAAGQLPPSERARYTRARESLEALRQDPDALVLADVSGALERRDPVGSSEALDILRRLETVSPERLAAEAETPTRLGQWSALALDLRDKLVQHADPLQAAGDWATLNPLHPVDEAAYLEIAWQYGQRFTAPGRIAVLLPTDGAFSAAANAIRDGLVSAWLDYPNRSELTFFEVGDDPASALSAYREAEERGYDWVIGPLRREAVQLVADQPGAAVPGLLLNWPEGQVPAGPFAETPEAGPGEVDFFSISLSQQAEAQSVARRMLRDGHRRTILLLADNEWGERVEEAFVDEYLAGGGEVVSLERFATGQADHSERLTRLLQIEDGRERKQRLQGLLGIPLEYQDSRRDDFGAFFMAADPVLGRQLKPQLRFFDAGEKTVFAMSRVYSGQADPGADVDLNGVVIPATPWALAETDGDAPDLASMRGGAFEPLYALGRDAWNVLPWLDLMTRNRQFTVPGAIGELTLGQDGRLLREPAWAVFRRGRPESLASAP